MKIFNNFIVFFRKLKRKKNDDFVVSKETRKRFCVTININVLIYNFLMLISLVSNFDSTIIHNENNDKSLNEESKNISRDFFVS